jgi:4-diphosphocytidyl-2-C-methyl-D-erythritol kinase
MVKLLAEETPAKINLFLRVVGRRPDGYHELDSVFVPISLSDQVRVEIRPAPARSVNVRCDRADVPGGERNLAWRAAAAFLREFELGGSVLIDLRKEIPPGAGLGGGSSDAGAVLRMMAALCRIDDASRLGRVALTIGADVPYFLAPRAAHVGGIGERITPLERCERLRMVIAVPPFEVSTAEIFGGLSPEQWSGPAPAEHLRAIATGRIRPETLQNDLAAVAMERYPEIARLKRALEGAGAWAAAMSGSGGAVFGLFAGEEQATRAADALGGEFPQTRLFVAHSVG